MAIAVAPSASVPAVEPRASADKEAVVEPVSAVEPIRRAGVGIIRVVSPFAGWGTVYIDRGRVINHRAKADADRDLSVGGSGYERQGRRE
jgi:hypothetical protein